ncbi:hypothetical protein J6590_012542 [Homalodisca vitripennis]|nr:hypothetical protein J6590_012542 [Homalodisca vitripennis]
MVPTGPAWGAEPIIGIKAQPYSLFTVTTRFGNGSALTQPIPGESRALIGSTLNAAPPFILGRLYLRLVLCGKRRGEPNLKTNQLFDAIS